MLGNPDEAGKTNREEGKPALYPLGSASGGCHVNMDYATLIRTYDTLFWCLDDLEDVLDNFNEDFKDWLSKKTERAGE